MRDTEGMRRLMAWLEADPKNRSRADLGKRLGIKGQAVTNWLRGVCPPNESLWELLEAVTGIPGIAFLTEAEKAKRDERLARDAERLREAQAQRPSDPEAA